MSKYGKNRAEYLAEKKVKELVLKLCGKNFQERNGIKISAKKWNETQKNPRFTADGKEVILLCSEGVIEIDNINRESGMYEMLSCGDRYPIENMKQAIEQLMESIDGKDLKIFEKGKFVEGAGEV